MTRQIPFHRPSVGEREIAEVVDVLRSGWLTSGPAASRLERLVAEHVGAVGSLATNSCTAALHVALRAMGVGPGDEVIVPTWTFCATANVIEHLGARVRLVDVNDELNMAAEALPKAISPRTKAVIPVHFAGLPCDIESVRALAWEKGIKVLEDGAHAIGACFPDGESVGSTPGTVAFSFYATKPMTTAEGGMLVSADRALLDRCRSLVLHGMTSTAWKRYESGGTWNYDVVEPGYKYNLSDLQAALGIGQVLNLEKARKHREELAQEYVRLLADLSPAITVPGIRQGHSWHLFVIRVRASIVSGGRQTVAASLAKAGVSTSVHFRPVHTLTYYRTKYGYRDGDFPTADAAFPEVLSLPIFPGLTLDDVRYICQAIRAAVQESAA